MRTEWIVVLTLYAVVLPVVTGLAALRVTKQTIVSDVFSNLTASTQSARNSAEISIHHNSERLQTVLRMVDAACGTSGVVNPDCAQSDLDTLLKEGALGTALTYSGRRGQVQTVTRGRVPQIRCVGGPCVTSDERGRLLYQLIENDKESGMTLSAVWPAASSFVITQGAADTAVFFHPSAGLWQAIGREDAARRVPLADLEHCITSGQVSPTADALSYRVLTPIASLPGACIVSYQRPDGVLNEARLRQGLLRLVGVFAAVSLLMAFVVSFATTRAIHALRVRMKTLKDGGELVPALNHSGPAEVRDLSLTFDRMAASLRHSQRALQASERRLSMAYKAANMMVWEHRVAAGVLLIQNPAVPEERMRLSLRRFLREIHPEDRRSAIAAIRLGVKTGSFSAEYRMKRNDGYFWCSSWGQAVDEEGARVLIGVSADVTAIKEAERYRAERERLLATTDMSGSLAHEINNPLAAVTGSLYMAERCTPGDPELASYLQIASLEAGRIAEIVRRLLQLHRTTTAPTSFDMVKLWEELIKSSSAQIDGCGLNVELFAQESAPVVGYEEDLHHGFKNLLTNAIESSSKGGSIKVKVRSAYSLRSGERGVRVLLCDNGNGVEAGKIEEFFEPFKTTKREKGTGLGLWVTRAAVLKQGGNIRMRSMPGNQTGTCVRIFLPNRPAA